jgi:hypothetical protein
LEAQLPADLSAIPIQALDPLKWLPIEEEREVCPLQGPGAMVMNA